MVSYWDLRLDTEKPAGGNQSFCFHPLAQLFVSISDLFSLAFNLFTVWTPAGFAHVYFPLDRD
jgi:hypothetical protein